MEYFVEEGSIVRSIWSKSDTVIFIFAGSAAEFALNKAVDWLYYTGKLPADPIGRLFSTVAYARAIIFSEKEKALKAIDKIREIHESVEASRQSKIPDWAYRDVLFMLIHYSIASFELLERTLTDQEKEDVYEVFRRVGTQMQLKNLPDSYTDWIPARQAHLEGDLEKSNFTVDLYKQYRKHLGDFRFAILKEGQSCVAPPLVKNLLNLKGNFFLRPIIPLYKLSRLLGMDKMIKKGILPRKYQKQIFDLDVPLSNLH